jgi:hypothetical protein
MGSSSRESTKQEMILNTAWHMMRNLDKITWHSAGAVKNWRQELIDDAEDIISQLNSFIAQVKGAE